MPGRNNRWLTILLLPLLFFPGCSGHDPVVSALPPDSVFSHQQMVLILSDLQLLESGLQLKKNRGEKTDSIATVWYNGLLGKYHMSAKRFRDNLDNYRKDKDGFISLYEDVIKRLEMMSAATPGKQHSEE